MENIPYSVRSSRKEIIDKALAAQADRLSDIRTEDDIDILALEVMDTDLESSELANSIQAARQNGEEASDLVGRQRKIFEETKRHVALYAGIPLEMDVREKQKAEYRKSAAKRFRKIDPDSSDMEVLVQLGFLKSQDDGTSVFSYPENFFPSYIDHEWNAYIDIVKLHVTSELKRQRGVEDDPARIAQLDNLRKKAHNTLSQSVADFLELPNWDLERCRRLMAKMRDERLPTLETAEESITASALRLFGREVMALSVETD